MAGEDRRVARGDETPRVPDLVLRTPADGAGRRMRVEAFMAGRHTARLARVEQRDPDEPTVFAAVVFVRDAEGSYVVVDNPRRGEWGSPGGRWEEGDRDARATAVREVWEETGLTVPREALVAEGFEIFTAEPADGSAAGALVVYSVDLPHIRPTLASHQPDAVDPQWVSWPELASRCSDQFWWHVAEAVHGAAGGPSPTAR